MQPTTTHTIRLQPVAAPPTHIVAQLTCLEPQGDEAQVGLQLRWDAGALEARGDDYFAALSALRLSLAALGLLPYCFGASIDVYPSGMIRSMGYGEQAYRLRLGYPARQADLVPIFEAAPDLPIGSVAEQAAYYDRWIASLRSAPA